jgi:hypothetical protein
MESRRQDIDDCLVLPAGSGKIELLITRGMVEGTNHGSIHGTSKAYASSS